MIHPDTEVRFINKDKGKGLFAGRPLPRGTIIWTLDPIDRQISAEEINAYEPRFQDILLTYSFRNNKGLYVFCWDNGRYINHSFSANCCLTPFNFNIAIRDIAQGEEITDDYGYLNIIAPFTAVPENSERTTVYPDDLLNYADLWDSQLQATFPHLLEVDQPLRPYLEKDTWQIIEDIVSARRILPSIACCYYPGEGQR